MPSPHSKRTRTAWTPIKKSATTTSNKARKAGAVKVNCIRYSLRKVHARPNFSVGPLFGEENMKTDYETCLEVLDQLPQRLLTQRTMLKLTQKDLAKRLGVSATALQNLEANGII